MGAAGRRLGTALLLGLMVVGCGNDGDNDNGIAFRAVGFFQGQVQDNRCQVPTSDSAIADQSVDIELDSSFVDSGFPQGIFLCRAYIWLENNLRNQSIVIDRLDFEYEIPGSRIGIPANSSSVGIRLNPANANADNQPSPFGPTNVYIGQPEAQIVPASVVLFLRQNRQVLPQLPYTMIVRVVARGQTDAGQRLTSNELRYTIQWSQELPF
ncbi:MAG: hypothetical protein AB7G75_16050 [Candidatus Binatia bacterium]